MTTIPPSPAIETERLYIGGRWVTPHGASPIGIHDSTSGELFLHVASATTADIDHAVAAARTAFDDGPWPRLTHAERATYLHAIAAELRARKADVGAFYPRETGALLSVSDGSVEKAAREYEYYAGVADTFPFDQLVTPSAGDFGLLTYEPVGVVGAIVPWNGPVVAISHKLAPALLAGCTVVLKTAPEAPVEGLIMAEIADQVGLPPGVLNVVVADRDVSETLVTDPRVDKIAFTGSTEAGRRIASLCGQRIARLNLELGGKSPAIVLDDAEVTEAAAVLAGAQCRISGQVCASLTRVIVVEDLYRPLVDGIAEHFAAVRVGDPYDPATQMGPLVSERQLQRVMGYIRWGTEDGAELIVGGGRPAGLSEGYFVEPTLFTAKDQRPRIAREEIFGPVMTVIPVPNEEAAIRAANDSEYGLNSSIFTNDVDRALRVARQVRAGTVGHNAMRIDFGIAFGGYKQSGFGREGGLEGLRQYLEAKTVILNGAPGHGLNLGHG